MAKYGKLAAKVLFAATIALLVSCKSKETSSTTGWKYNDPKNGGFEVADYKSPITGPGLVYIEGGTFTMGRIKLTGDAPDDGEKSILRTYPFTAELNSAGGAALAWDQTIITIQDSQA